MYVATFFILETKSNLPCDEKHVETLATSQSKQSKNFIEEYTLSGQQGARAISILHELHISYIFTFTFHFILVLCPLQMDCFGDQFGGRWRNLPFLPFILSNIWGASPANHFFIEILWYHENLSSQSLFHWNIVISCNSVAHKEPFLYEDAKLYI